MFCHNCGKEIDKNAVVCIHCGVGTINYNNQVNNAPSKGKSIASFVLSIAAVLYSLMAFVSFENLEEALAEYPTTGEHIAFAVGFVLVQSVLATIAICLGSSEKKKNTNSYNKFGFWLSLAAFVMIAIQFIYVATF